MHCPKVIEILVRQKPLRAEMIKMLDARTETWKMMGRFWGCLL